MLIAIEQVSDLIRTNLSELERNEIISSSSAEDFRSRALRLVPGLLLKLNNERAYRAKELEQQNTANSKQKHLNGLSRSIQGVWVVEKRKFFKGWKFLYHIS